MPISVGARDDGNLVVVNLQKTAADGYARLRIGAKIDDVMIPLMAELGLKIPEFTLKRHVKLEIADRGGCGGSRITFQGMDDRCEEMDLFWGVQVHHHDASDDHAESQPPVTFLSTVSRNTVGPIKIQINKSGPKAEAQRPGQGSVGILHSFPWNNANVRGMCGVTIGRMAWEIPRAMCDIVHSQTCLPCMRGSAVVETRGAGAAVFDLPAGRRMSRVVLIFRGHYGENPVAFAFSQAGRHLLASKKGVTFAIAYKPLQGRWDKQVEVLGSDYKVLVQEQGGENKVSDMHSVD